MPKLCFVTTCKGRLSFLKQTLPAMASQSESECVVVDYRCPDGTGDWVRKEFPDIEVVRVESDAPFNRSRAHNAGALASNSPWICFVDADVILAEEFAANVIPMLRSGNFYRADPIQEGTAGTIICKTDDLRRVEGYDVTYQGWGCEDDDLCDALQFSGLVRRGFPSQWLHHIEHGDGLRMQFHQLNERSVNEQVNLVYRAIKWDAARVWKKTLSETARRSLYEKVSRKITEAIANGEDVEIELPMGSAPVIAGRALSRFLRYRFELKA